MSHEQLLEEEREVEKLREGKKATLEMKEKSLEEALKTLNELREEAGQISELATEENMLATELLAAILKIMKSLAQTLPVSTAVFPKRWGEVSQANLDINGQLLVLYPNGTMKSTKLTEQEHRELLLKITYDIMPKLKKLIISHRQKIEERVKFMSSVTKELQNTAKAFSPDNSK